MRKRIGTVSIAASRPPPMLTPMMVDAVYARLTLLLVVRFQKVKGQ